MTRDDGPSRSNHIWTIPNGLCLIRLLGSFALVLLAWQQRPTAYFWCMLILLATDWVDGKLAILLRQTSTFGARFDSLADVTMYTALLIGLVVLRFDVVQREWPWLLGVPISYGLATLAGLLKFGRVPSYHTRSAKTSWLLVTLAVIALFGAGSIWPLRVAVTAVVVANVESLLITNSLAECRTDVSSWWNVK